MHTRLHGQRGFTLFEMLLVMVIIGVVTAVGFSISLFQPDSLDTATQMVMRQVSEGRSRAILLRQPVTLHMDSRELRLSPESRSTPETLPDDVRVTSINAFPPDAEHGKLVFHPFGIVRESAIQMEQASRSGQVRQCTVYVPSVGAPRVLNGHQDIDSIMKELL